MKPELQQSKEPNKNRKPNVAEPLYNLREMLKRLDKIVHERGQIESNGTLHVLLNARPIRHLHEISVAAKWVGLNYVKSWTMQHKSLNGF